MSIEELLGPGERAAPVAAAPVAQLGGEGARVTLASVGDGYVALPLRGVTASRGGFRPAPVARKRVSRGLARLRQRLEHDA